MVRSGDQNRLELVDKTRSKIEIERRLVRLANVMDTMFRIPVLGWRFGLNTIIDLIPGIGDTATSIISFYLVVSGLRYRVPKITLLRMMINTGIYYVVGLVPVAGAIFDTWWKPNKRNLELLRRHATVSASEAHELRRGDLLFVGIIFLFLSLLVAGTFVLAYIGAQFAADVVNGHATF